MGNLGMYQVIPTIAKKVGGPFALIAITMVSGWAIGRGAEAGGKGVFKRVKTVRREQAASRDAAEWFTVSADAACGGGLTLGVGEKFKVLSRDGDAVLIEVHENANNPYFVAAEVLARVSEFPG